MAGKWRVARGGRTWNPGYLVLATVMLSLVMVAAGCGSGNSNHVNIIVPTHTPTPSEAAPTPTPSTAASVTPTAVVSTTPTATSSGPTPTVTATPGPVALWVENTGMNPTGPASPGSVNEFTGTTLSSPGVSVPAPTVRNMSTDITTDTSGVSVDSSNTQWVSVCGSATNPGSIAGFSATTLKNLKTTPAPAANVLLSDSSAKGNLINCPWATTFDASGNMWVANSNENGILTTQGFVTDYLPSQLTASSGSTVPNVTLLDPTEFVSPTGVAFDLTGNLFVSDFGAQQTPFPGGKAAGKVWVFKAATVAGLTGKVTKTADASLSAAGMSTPVNAAVDPSGHLWVVDCFANEIFEFDAPTTSTSTATRTFTSTTVTIPSGNEDSFNCPGGIAFDNAGDLWYTNFESTQAGKGVRGAVGEFTAGQLTGAPAGPSAPVPHIFLEGDTTGTNFHSPIGLTFGPEF